MDQIEFSAPVEVAANFARAIGLHWFAVTDHSYDLDAPLDDDFAIDPDLPRWENLKAEVRDVNSRFDDLVVMLGEEVSCGNSKGQNVHLLVYGTPEFIPGRGDAGKTGFAFEFHPDLSVGEVLDKVRAYDGVAYAAHPDADNSFLGRLIVNRGTWLDEDCKLPGCSGLQFWNGCSGKRYTRGYKRWIRLLLEGYKRYIIAGSDAHGDFNRFRKMIFPFVKLGESTRSSFAKPRTALYCGATLNEERILDSLRNGKAVLTDGPLSIFSVQNDYGETASIGDTISGNRFELKIQAKSTEEFGELHSAKLYRGNLSQKRESVESEISLKGYEHSSSHSIIANTDCYLRLEVTSRQNQHEHRCITNPVWLKDYRLGG